MIWQADYKIGFMKKVVIFGFGVGRIKRPVEEMVMFGRGLGGYGL